jgi:hypothetical protein
MRRLAPPLSLGLICLLAIVAIRCGGDSPTGPTTATRREALSVPEQRPDLSTLAEENADRAPDLNALALALARLGDVSRASDLGDVQSLSPADWAITIVRAPKTGTTMKVNKHGILPQPAPKFRLKLEAAVSVPQSGVLVIFLTSGGKECGLATTPRLFPLTANTPKSVDIPNDYIIVGPEACFLDGQNCTPTQCKFPLNTTKMKIIFGNKDQGVRQGTTSIKYKWVT